MMVGGGSFACTIALVSLACTIPARGLLGRAAATGFVRFTSMSHGSIGIVHINGVFDRTGFGMSNQQNVEKGDLELLNSAIER